MRVLLAVLGLLAAAALLPAPAHAALSKASLRILNDYRTDGRISACRHSEADLQRAVREVPPDIEQYAPDYPAALEAALEARARGQCDRSRSAGDGKPGSAGAAGDASPPAATSAPAPAATPAGAPAGAAGAPAAAGPVAEPPAPAAATAPPAGPAGEREVATRAAVTQPANASPAPVLALALLCGLLALVALLSVLTRLTGVGEQRLDRARHAWSEAAWRTQGVWQDFADWVRLGR